MSEVCFKFNVIGIIVYTIIYTYIIIHTQLYIHIHIRVYISVYNLKIYSWALAAQS
jgi:hypothetical protein